MSIYKSIRETSTVSETYIAEYCSLMAAYSAAQTAIDKKWSALLLELDGNEIAHAPEPPIAIGTRVWSSSHRRPGTVISAKAIVCHAADQYYSDRVGPGQYEQVDPVDDRVRFPIQWRYTCETDPSPRLGKVATWKASTLYGFIDEEKS